MPFKNFILIIYFALLYFSAYTQKGIIVETKEKEVTVKLNGYGDEYITLIIQNNTNDTLTIPPDESDPNQVLIKIPPHNKYYWYEVLLLQYLIIPPQQILLPHRTARVRVSIHWSLFKRKGRTRIRLYPVIRNSKGKKLTPKSNKVIVTVE